MYKVSIIGGLVAVGALLAPLHASASTITGWDTNNVAVGPVIPDDAAPEDATGASIIYQDGAQTVTNGKIVYAAPEANSPGIKIEGGDPDRGALAPYPGTQNQTFDGCIMTSSEAFCNSPFQSGKRIKQQITNEGAIDLVFGVAVTNDTVDADGNPIDVVNDTSVYQVFHRLINVTGGDLSGFTLELGTGVGDGTDGFKASGTGDGLSFATTDASLNPANPLTLGPDKLTSFSQYPFGLFGGEPLNPNPLELKGFFDIGSATDNGRAGFEVTQTEDKIASGAYYGSYDNLFGNWLSQDDVPEALFWDYASGAADPLLMAWLNDDGLWEIRRDIAQGVIQGDGSWDLDYVLDIENNGPTVLSLIEDDWKTFATIGEVADEFGLASLLQGPIEDLANLNMSFGIELSDMFARSNETFTLRVTSIAAPSPVPLPAGMPLLLAGLAGLGFLSRRRRAAG